MSLLGGVSNSFSLIWIIGLSRRQKVIDPSVRSSRSRKPKVAAKQPQESSAFLKKADRKIQSLSSTPFHLTQTENSLFFTIKNRLLILEVQSSVQSAEKLFFLSPPRLCFVNHPEKRSLSTVGNCVCTKQPHCGVKFISFMIIVCCNRHYSAKRRTAVESWKRAENEIWINIFLRYWLFGFFCALLVSPALVNELFLMMILAVPEKKRTREKSWSERQEDCHKTRQGEVIVKNLDREFIDVRCFMTSLLFEVLMKNHQLSRLLHLDKQRKGGENLHYWLE
jgi:hypothetical protein